MSNVYKNPDSVTQIAASDTHPLTFTNWEPCTWLGVALVASTCVHVILHHLIIFPSGLLATPTTVSKTPRGRCVHRVKRPYCVYFQPLNGTQKHILTVFTL